MKKISLLLAFVAFFSVASFAKSNTTTSTAKVIKGKAFPVTFTTSCGTWTGTADCGSASLQECANFLNEVGNFLESLCES